MSKLTDAIRRSQRIESAPMGFGAARPAPKATMLVGYVSDDAAAADRGREAGAEVVLLRSVARAVVAGDVEKLDAKSAPVGVWADFTNGAMAELQKAGVDFLVVNPDTTPAATLLNEDLGYVLVLPRDPDELLLRSLEPLSLDALLLADLPSPLTVTRQIELTRVSAFTHKPLICQVKPDVSTEELQCLRAAGCVLLLIEGATEGIGKLKEKVLSLPAKRRPRDDRPLVALPRGQAMPEGDDDDDDDE
jgi:hypothetical protein